MDTISSSDFEPLCNQIGGRHEYAERKFSIMKHSNGNVLKPLPDGRRGEAELKFYELVSTSKDDAMINELSKFIPNYKGTVSICLNNKEVQYLQLENIGERFIHPCNLDIKIGAITTDPYATKKKITTHLLKYPEAMLIGFRILGMHIYDEGSNRYNSIDRGLGLSLTAETVVDGLYVYFNKLNTFFTLLIVCSFLHRLKTIESWFLTQRRFSFYGSSLLFFYEGCTPTWVSFLQDWLCSHVFDKFITKEKLKSLILALQNLTASTLNDTRLRNDIHKTFISNFIFADKDTVCSICYLDRDICLKVQLTFPLTDVRMVDFAHICDSQFEDTNYLFGLYKLIEVFQKLQEELLHKCKTELNDSQIPGDLPKSENFHS